MAALTLPETAPVWVHQAAGNPLVSLGMAIDAAQSRAADPKSWASGSLEDRSRDFRALMIASAYLAQAFSMFPVEGGTLGTQSAVKINIPDDASAYTNAERASIGAALGRTLKLLDQRATILGASGASQTRLLTIGGSVPTPIPDSMLPKPTEAGAFPVLEVVAIVVGAATICFLAERTAQIVDRALARSADSAAMVATQGQLADVLQKHRQAEKDAGKELPLSTAEADVLKRLQTLQDDYSKRNATNGPFPELFPSSGGVTGMGIIAIIVIGAVVLLRK